MTQPEQTLKQFHDAANWKSMTLGNHVWRYATGGSGSECLMIIHGGGGDAELMFSYFVALAPHFKLIVPSVPTALDNMQVITDGLRSLLDNEGIEQTHVFGSSLGGWMAQALAAQQPERVSKCIFSHCSLPQSKIGALMRKMRLPLKLMPMRLFRWQTLRGQRKEFAEQIPDITPEESAFWMARWQHIFGERLGKVDLMASIELQIDFHERTDLTTAPIRNEPDRVLILYHENDSDFGAETAAAMQAFYGDAKCLCLPLYGHVGALVRSEVMFEPMKQFLTD
ncbi:MAG: alpha/beta hydrolase [Chloroflexota bacterium]